MFKYINLLKLINISKNLIIIYDYVSHACPRQARPEPFSVLLQSSMSKSFITTAQTTNFRHLVQLQRRKKLPGIQERKSVPVKDRIKWWNIVPGDRVRLMTDKENRLHEVKGINKYWNRVYVDNEKSVRIKSLLKYLFSPDSYTLLLLRRGKSILKRTSNLLLSKTYIILVSSYILETLISRRYLARVRRGISRMLNISF